MISTPHRTVTTHMEAYYLNIPNHQTTQKTRPPNVEYEERTLCASDKDEPVKVERERVESVRKQIWPTKQAMKLVEA